MADSGIREVKIPNADLYLADLGATLEKSAVFFLQDARVNNDVYYSRGNSSLRLAQRIIHQTERITKQRTMERLVREVY